MRYHGVVAVPWHTEATPWQVHWTPRGTPRTPESLRERSVETLWDRSGPDVVGQNAVKVYTLRVL